MKAKIYTIRLGVIISTLQSLHEYYLLLLIIFNDFLKKTTFIFKATSNCGPFSPSLLVRCRTTSSLS